MPHGPMARRTPVVHKPDGEDALALHSLLGVALVDFRQYLSAEFELARAETANLFRRMLMGVGLAFAGFALFLASIVMFSQAMAAVLAPFAGPIMAGLIVGLVLLAIAAGLILACRFVFSTAPWPGRGVLRRLGTLRSAAEDVQQ